VIALGTLDPYPYPRLYWEDEELGDGETWLIYSENGSGGNGDNGGNVDDGNGDDSGNGLDDFDWSTGIPTEQVWPGGGTPAWARILIFRGTSGPPSVFSPNFITRGTSADLLKAVKAYNQALLSFELNKDSMTEAEYAVAVIELAVARAAIMIVEAMLSGNPTALAAAIEAYEFALQQLADYGDYLTEDQTSFVASLLSAIDNVIASQST